MQHLPSQCFAPYASPLPQGGGNLGVAGYTPHGGAAGQVQWAQQPQVQPPPGRNVSLEGARPQLQQPGRTLSVEGGPLRQFSADLTPGGPPAGHRPGQQPQPVYQQPGPFGPGPPARMGAPPVSYQGARSSSLASSGPFSFLPGVHDSRLLSPQTFAFDAIQEDPRNVAGVAAGQPPLQAGGETPHSGRGGTAASLAPPQNAGTAPQAALQAPQAAQQSAQQQAAQPGQQPPGQAAQATGQPGALPAMLQEPERAAKRAALCQQAFKFVDALRTGYIDMSQNKTGLTMVFEQLDDPMPKDEWYVRVFRNFVRDERDLLDFKGFAEIVVQWDEHHLKKRRQRAKEQAAEAQASPAEAQRREVLPPPPPRGDSLHSVKSSASQEAEGAGSMLSAASAGESSAPETRASASAADAPGSSAASEALDAATFASAVEGSWRQGEAAERFASATGASKSVPPQEQVDVTPLTRATPASASRVPPEMPEKALLLTGREVVGEAVRHSPSAESDDATGPSRATSTTTRVTAADLVSEVLFPTYVGRLAIFDDYEFFGDVGSGSFGKVMVVRHKQTKQLRACKVVAVQTALQRELIDTEIKLLKNLNHPNIMKMHEVYFEQDCDRGRVTNGNIYLVTELCEGGDLFSRILHHYERLKQPMTESHVAFMMQQILSATKYCHDQDIIHRDIKPENILFVDRSSSSPLKIIDFGLANFTEQIREQAKEVKIPRGGAVGRLARMLPSVNGKHLIPWHERKKVMQKAGTPHYMAPEMIEGCYDQKADLFSIGIILCQLFTGWHPFYAPGDDEHSVRAKITLPEPVHFPREVWEPVSKDALDLTRKLLEKCPRSRLSAAQALAHPWFRDPAKPSPFGNVSGLSISIFDGLMQYQAYNKLKRAVLQLLTRELSEFQIQELRKKFMALDTQGDGLLSPEELVDGMRHVGYEMSDAELKQVMAALDGTGRQRIGYKEFISALIERRVKFDRQQLWECFKKFDTEGTGKITYDNVKSIMSPALTESEWQEIAAFGSQAAMTANPELTFEQFVALMEQTET